MSNWPPFTLVEEGVERNGVHWQQLHFSEDLVDDFIRNARLSSNRPPGPPPTPPSPHLWSFTPLGAFVALLKKLYFSVSERKPCSSHANTHSLVPLFSDLHNCTRCFLHTIALSVMRRFCCVSCIKLILSYMLNSYLGADTTLCPFKQKNPFDLQYYWALILTRGICRAWTT